MKEDLPLVVGLLALAAAAWIVPAARRAWDSSHPPPPVVVFSPGPDQPLQWSPSTGLPEDSRKDGSVLDPRGQAAGPVPGWRGLLLGHPLDLNAATVEDLDSLPGVGPKTAEAIFEARERLGGFSRVDDLLQIRGIGPKKLEQMRQWLAVRAPSAPRSASAPKP